MVKEQDLEYLIRELKWLQSSQDRAEKFVERLRELHDDKTSLLIQFLEFASSFENLKKIQRGRDPSGLLHALKANIGEEQECIQEIEGKTRESHNVVKNVEADIESYFADPSRAREFFAYLDQLYSLFFACFTRLSQRLTKEEEFVRSWESIPPFGWGKGDSIVENWKKSITCLKTDLEQEVIERDRFSSAFESCESKIKDDASSVKLKSPTLIRSGRMRVSRAEQQLEQATEHSLRTTRMTQPKKRGLDVDDVIKTIEDLGEVLGWD